MGLFLRKWQPWKIQLLVESGYISWMTREEKWKMSGKGQQQNLSHLEPIEQVAQEEKRGGKEDKVEHVNVSFSEKSCIFDKGTLMFQN